MRIPVFDAHCDTIMKVKAQNCGIRSNNFHIDIERGMKYSPYAQVFAVFTRPFEGMPSDYSKDWPLEVLTQMCGELLNLLLNELTKNSDIVSLCRTVEDIDSAARDGKAAALIAVEGAELLGCDIERLKIAYSKGVRLVNLSWNYDNDICGAASGAAGGGLTEKGRKFVKAMQGMGMVVDLSHASERTFWDVAEITERPIIAGHSDSRAICDHPRNLTDEQFKAVVKLQGAVGLNMYPKFLNEDGIAGVDDVMRHAEHFLSLGGEKTLCLGSDFDGIETMPQGMTGIESYEMLYEEMLKRNFPETLVRDIFYYNLYTVLERVL